MCVATASPPASTEEATTSACTADEAAIRCLFRDLLDAWDRGDGHAYGAAFTDDADYVAFDGSHTCGRTAIAEWHQQLFDRWLKGTRLSGQIERTRFVSDEVAILVATGATLFAGATRPRRPSIQTLVATKRDGAWRFTAFHNTRIQHRSRLQWLLFGIATRVFHR
jgi:uncharacterized protein (TIGR02246 family)